MEDLIMIELKPISILDEEMVECMHLSVTEEQYDFVAPNSVSLAEAYDINKKAAENSEGSRVNPYAVYKNGEMFGLVMIAYVYPDNNVGFEAYYDEPYYYLMRIFVDKEFQGKGLGKEVLRLAMEKVKSKYLGDANWCFSSYVPENTASKRTFASYGFAEDGRVIDEESVCKIGI